MAVFLGFEVYDQFRNTELYGFLDLVNSLCNGYCKYEVRFPQRVEIWDALRAAAEADLSLAQAIVDSAGVIVQSADLTICYDERGAYSILHFFFFLVTLCSMQTNCFVSVKNSLQCSISLKNEKYDPPL